MDAFFIAFSLSSSHLPGDVELRKSHDERNFKMKAP